jgi:pyrimidine-nucleoside phosphorylase
MIKIGKVYNREVRCMISDMNTPLGKCIGNSLEVLEAIDILKGKEKDTNLYDLCIELASEMVSMGLNISLDEAKELVVDSIDNGSAYNKFLELVKYQKGKIEGIKVSDKTYKIKSKDSGIIKKINALELGKLSLSLGAGKVSIKDKIDYSVGIKLNKFIGDNVKRGDVLATLYIKNNNFNVDIDNIFIIE